MWGGDYATTGSLPQCCLVTTANSQLQAWLSLQQFACVLKGRVPTAVGPKGSVKTTALHLPGLHSPPQPKQNYMTRANHGSRKSRPARGPCTATSTTKRQEDKETPATGTMTTVTTTCHCVRDNDHNYMEEENIPILTTEDANGQGEGTTTTTMTRKTVMRMDYRRGIADKKDQRLRLKESFDN